MIEQWFLRDIEHQISRGKRAVILDPDGRCGFLMRILAELIY